MVKRFFKMNGKYQFGGEDTDDSSDFFNNLADTTINAQQFEGDPQEEFPQGEDQNQQPEQSDSDIADLQQKYDELSQNYQELESQLSQTGMRMSDQSTGDNFLDFLFGEDQSNLPVTFDEAPSFQEDTKPEDEEDYSPITTNFSLSFSEEDPLKNSLKSKIATRESPGSDPYKVVPRKKDGKLASSAAGKYQFLWSAWGDSIKKVTGVKSKQDFLNNPQAQEKYFNFYDRTVLGPEAKKVLPGLRKKYPNITEEQAKLMIHFGGIGNVNKAIKTGNFGKKLDSFGTSLSKYAFQYGGQKVALTPQEQYHGLNNPNYNSMYFPNKGMNTFRGLDNGKPVMLQDELGKKLILKGRHHTAAMYGNVFENRVN